MPEITVVITTYNLEAYIGTCLEELFSGTYQDFDVVLVDDGSKDQTVDIDIPGGFIRFFCKKTWAVRRKPEIGR